MDGWYYLHTNGEIIYKRELGSTAADIRESPFARMLWPMDPSDREMAWRILVEAQALGARLGRIEELKTKWGCTDEDAPHYAERIGIRLFKDGSDWCATKADFINLQESPSGHGPSCLDAISELCKELNFQPSKMWGATFHDLVKCEEITHD